MVAITTTEELRGRFAKPSERVLLKQLDRLDVHARRFIEYSPFAVVATAGEGGRLDATPRGGQPGFVAVVDEGTLLIPERPGNNRLDSLTNLIHNPEVGLLFLIPGVDETLRVNGVAELRDDLELRSRFEVFERAPAVVVQVKVREVFPHCAKALMRSHLWDEQSKIARSALPTMGEMLRDQLGLAGEAESQAAMVERYRAQL
jgi:uncharacterized protein